MSSHLYRARPTNPLPYSNNNPRPSRAQNIIRRHGYEPNPPAAEYHALPAYERDLRHYAVTQATRPRPVNRQRPLGSFLNPIGIEELIPDRTPRRYHQRGLFAEQFYHAPPRDDIERALIVHPRGRQPRAPDVIHLLDLAILAQELQHQYRHLTLAEIIYLADESADLWNSRPHTQQNLDAIRAAIRETWLERSIRIGTMRH